MLRRKNYGHPTIAKAKKRLDNIPRADVLMWADNAGSAISRELYSYQSSGEPQHLVDMEHALLTLIGAVRSLQERDKVSG